MKSIEREIKILSHVDQIEHSLDLLKVKSTIETQQVFAVKLANRSIKLKIRKFDQGVGVFELSVKDTVKPTGNELNKHFSNKEETIHTLTEENFLHFINSFRIFPKHMVMQYVIEKKRYEPFMGYKIDVCRIIESKDNNIYYKDKFIEVEEGPIVLVPVEEMLTNIIPNEKNIFTINCGIRNLSRLSEKISIIETRHKTF